MSEATKAVFLSYASQDADAAARISASLRAAGVEVWFDQSELRGGEVWDQKIRREIRDCALFVPIISRNTQARTEGYFRLEWRLADQRTHLMAKSRAFLVPVCIDDTRDADAEVPDSFSAVQWTRLPAGETPAAFAERVSRLLAPDQRVSSAAASPQSLADAVAERGAPPKGQVTHTRGFGGWKPTLLITAAVVIAVSYFAIARLGKPRDITAAVSALTPAVQPVASAHTAIPEKSIAVLPFTDMSEKKDQEYFSDGLSEELIDLLAKVPDLRVPARTSSFFFKGKQATVTEIAKTLGVSHVLEGSVRKAGNTIRVTAQLIRADEGYHLWSETYDRELKDVFKVQDEIASAVVSALRLKLAPGQQAPSSHRTSNPEAYNQYLLGRQFDERENLDGWRRAVDAYREAIELDPNYALAYAALSHSLSALAAWTGDAAGLQQALTAADKAVMFAPDLAAGYSARALLRFTISWDWIGAQADFEKALALDPADSTIQNRYGQLLESLGRLPEAIAATKRATEIDPLSAVSWDGLGDCLIASRQFAAARKAIHRALEIQPESGWALNNLGTIELLEGNAAAALTTFRQVSIEGKRLSGIAMSAYTLGHGTESQNTLDELIAKDAQGAAYEIAEVYAWRGEKDRAFDWLGRAHRQRDPGVSYIKYDLLLDSLRGDARLAAMFRKMHLPE